MGWTRRGRSDRSWQPEDEERVKRIMQDVYKDIPLAFEMAKEHGQILHTNWADYQWEDETHMAQGNDPAERLMRKAQIGEE